LGGDKKDESSSKHITLQIGLKKSMENFCSPHPFYPHYPQRIIHVLKKYDKNNKIITTTQFYA
jgi:hypothetical protein